MDIIKTWPATIPTKTTAGVFSATCVFSDFYFTLGRGKPKQDIEHLWFTYRGRILGSFLVMRIVINDGSLPRLHRLDGGESEWQIAPDMWVAVCYFFERAGHRVYMSGFRGFRYFNYDEYRKTPDARIRL